MDASSLITIINYPHYYGILIMVSEPTEICTSHYCITGFFQGQHISQISRNLGQLVKITDMKKIPTQLNH